MTMALVNDGVNQGEINQKIWMSMILAIMSWGREYI